MKLKKEDFPEKTTARKLKLHEIEKNSLTHKLIKKLNTPSSLSAAIDKESIMIYGNLCYHDDGFLCECRLQWIIDFMKFGKRKAKLKRILK